MKAQYIEKKLQKLGTVQKFGNDITVVAKRSDGREFIICAHKSPFNENIQLISMRRVNDIPDSQTDYFPGFFPKTFNEIQRALA